MQTLLHKPRLLLALLAFALLTPGLLALPPTDRDESRFAVASRQMVESGNWLDIRFQEETRYKKPIGIYWLQAASATLTGAPERIASYRIPSLLAAIAAVLGLYAFAQRAVGKEKALAAAVLFTCTLLLAVEARLAKTDAVLLACALAAQGIMGLAYLRAAPKRAAPLFWLAMALGVLIKGPVLPLLSFLTFASVSIADRSARWAKPLLSLPALALFAACVLPWFFYISAHSGGAFWREALLKDFGAKLASAQEKHGLPPGYFMLTSLITLWPASLLLPPALALAWRNRREALPRFCLAWIIPMWLALELTPTKLPHYIFPLFPALTLLMAQVSRVPRWWAAAWAVLTLTLSCALALLPHLLKVEMPLALLIAGVMALLGLFTAWQTWRIGRPRLRCLVLLAALPTLYIGGVLPRLEPLWISLEAAKLAETPVISVGYGEPSLVFLLDGKVRFLSPQALAHEARNRMTLIVEEREWEKAQAALSRTELKTVALGEVEGFNYGNGHPARLRIMRLEHP